MTGRRAFVLLAVIVLAAWSLSAPAWAHPGRMPDAEFAGSAPTSLEAPDGTEVGSAPYHRWLSLVAPLVGALALLASLADRRRTLGFLLAVLLGTAASEGAFHALVHLQHLAHSDGLAVGLSASQQAATDAKDAAPGPIALPLLGKAAPDRPLASLTEVAVTSDRERAPPISPA